MPTRSSSRRYWYALGIVILFLCVAIPLWKFHDAARPGRVEPSSGTRPKVEIVAKNLSSKLTRLPLLLPGDTCDKADGELGKPVEEDKFSRTWETNGFIITAATDSACHLTTIAISVLPGHKAITADGITLGESTLADAEKVAGKPLIERSESVEAAEGHWVGTIQFSAAPGTPFTAAYSAYLSSDKSDAMNHDPLIDDFRNLPITHYNLEMVAPHSQAK
jgi:hypothetical protein